MFTIVRNHTVKFLERAGKINQALKPGIHFYIPLVDRIGKTIELREHFKKYEIGKVTTKDKVDLEMESILFYEITDPEKAAYNSDNYEKKLNEHVLSIVQSEVGRTDMDDILHNRTEINERIRNLINENLADTGIECLNYEVSSVTLPENIKNRFKELAEAELSKKRNDILSTTNKEYKIALAEIERISQLKIAEAKAEVGRVKAEELAKCLSELSEKLGKGDNAKIVMDFTLTQSYIKKYSNMLNRANVTVVPENSDGKFDSGLISLAYIMQGANRNSTEQPAKENTADLWNFDIYNDKSLPDPEVKELSANRTSPKEEVKSVVKAENELKQEKPDSGDIESFMTKLEPFQKEVKIKK